MEKITVSTLLKNPSLAHGYLAAGRNGINRKIDHLDVLEHPYPEVEIYLLQDEFILTSFWNSKKNKEARINLVKAMIEHGCAGIGIMPGLHLNKMVDPEIIELGNQYDFPVVILDEDCLYSDIIKEFYQQIFRPKSSLLQHTLYTLLTILDQYKADANLLRLGIDLERTLAHPIVISNGDEHYVSAHIANTKILSKIQSIFFKKSYIPYTPVYPFINSYTQVACIFGINSYIALFASSSSGVGEHESYFFDTGTYLLRYLDSQNSEKIPIGIDKNLLSETDRFFLFYLKTPQLVQFLNKKSNDYFVYDYNRISNHVIGLWRDIEDSSGSIFSFCAKLLREYSPTCLVFTDHPVQTKQITKLSKYIVKQMEPLFINGIFTVGELPVLNLLNIAPTTTKARIINYGNLYINPKAKQVYQDTTRLFLVLRSITKVSELLDIHTNTVKYRIQKVLNNECGDDFNVLAARHNMECLLSLENLKLSSQAGDMDSLD